MNILYLILILIAIIVYIALFHVDAGYGKFFNPRWGPSIGNRAGWILMEAPAFIVMLVIYLASPARQMGSVAPLVFSISTRLVRPARRATSLISRLITWSRRCGIR